MKHKTAELTGAYLDLAVAMAEGKEAPCIRQPLLLGQRATCSIFTHSGMAENVFAPSSDWRDGGPIIDRMDICIEGGGGCRAAEIRNDGPGRTQFGPTTLIAAMRCYVASVFGDEVDLP